MLSLKGIITALISISLAKVKTSTSIFLYSGKLLHLTDRDSSKFTQKKDWCAVICNWLGPEGFAEEGFRADLGLGRDTNGIFFAEVASSYGREVTASEVVSFYERGEGEGWVPPGVEGVTAELPPAEWTSFCKLWGGNDICVTPGLIEASSLGGEEPMAMSSLGLGDVSVSPD